MLDRSSRSQRLRRETFQRRAIQRSFTAPALGSAPKASGPSDPGNIGPRLVRTSPSAARESSGRSIGLDSGGGGTFVGAPPPGATASAIQPGKVPRRLRRWMRPATRPKRASTGPRRSRMAKVAASTGNGSEEGRQSGGSTQAPPCAVRAFRRREAGAGGVPGREGQAAAGSSGRTWITGKFGRPGADRLTVRLIGAGPAICARVPPPRLRGRDGSRSR